MRKLLGDFFFYIYILYKSGSRTQGLTVPGESYFKKRKKKSSSQQMHRRGGGCTERGENEFAFILIREPPLQKIKNKKRKESSTELCPFLTLITTFRVVRWPCCWAAINPEDRGGERRRRTRRRTRRRKKKKDTRCKVNKYQQMCSVYSSQYIVSQFDS